MKVEITVQGAPYECIRFTAEGSTTSGLKAELDTVVSEVQSLGWDAYEALVALRDGRHAPEVAAPQAALPTADELIKSELGGTVIDVVNSTASEEVPFWGRKSEPQAAVPAAVPAAPAAMPSFF